MSKKLFKSFGYKAIHIIALVLNSILLIPILLKYWDLKLYGAWIALYSFFNLIQVLGLGHSVFVGNEFNRLVHKNKEKAKIALGSAFRVNFLVSFLELAIVAFIYFTGILSFFLDEEIDSSIVATVLSMFFIYRMIIGSYRGLAVKILNPFGYIYKAFQFALYESIIEFLVLVIAAIVGLDLIGLAILWVILKSLLSLFVLLQVRKILPEYFPWWKYGSLKNGIKNFRISSSFATSNFLDRLSNDGLVLIVSAFAGTTILPLFAATKTIVNFGLKLSELYLSPLAPEMIIFYARDQKTKILDVFKSFWFVTGVLLIGGYTISLFFIEDLFTLWTHGKLEFNLVLYSALIIILLIQNYGKIITTFFTGINKTNIVLLTSIIRIFLLFTVAFLFKELGLYAILLGLFISEVCISLFWLPYNAFTVFEYSTAGKAKFLINFFTVLLLGVLYYFNYMGIGVFPLIVFFLPIVAMLFYQYTLISKNTRGMVTRSFKKLITFAAK
ncbi:MATE family efflux transporter [Marixanthomonas ophiurae]|uniref:Polysaccharide biosynthesis protein C-terminal domain-containing protein n=1 Tax=Marixanthomonas ophiurae TaxID=387659 RepID=A0A3E1Q772_9FLAO|nr:hypothetical protein [Marixanthomonas ophiurae]RFN57973.1 hypothetical protein DZ858_12075 [Marixanthomonas ophiurae]